jgi:hypothetical protein
MLVVIVLLSSTRCWDGEFKGLDPELFLRRMLKRIANIQ